MTSPENQIAQWLEEYESPTANVAAILCDRHPADAPAFTVIDADLSSQTVSYGELADRSRRLATVLRESGIEPEDRVAVLMSKRADLVVTLLALARLGAVYVPLFTAFETGAIRLRVEGANAKLVITEADQRAKVEPIDSANIRDIDQLVAEAATAAPLSYTVAVGGNGIIIQLYTSGSTGNPKGVPVPVRALASFRAYLHYSLDVRPDDVYWNAADPGWAYGLFFAVVGPLLIGRPGILFRPAFTPQSTLAILRDFGVTNFAGAPTMYRAIRHLEPDAHGISLRCASSAGEPLTSDIVEWGRESLGTEVRDQYGQTELGMVIGNHWNPDVAQPPRPGSMGQPLPGITAGIFDGQIAIDVAHSPLMWFRGYHQNPDKTGERFSADGKWFLTADLGREEDGYFYFSSRDDDVILAAGYRIGPHDVESVLARHPDVADVAVVGLPDPEGIRGEVVHAFVVPRPGVDTDAALERELQALVRDTYSRHAYPRAVHFVDTLPRTVTGKVQRYLLRQS